MTHSTPGPAARTVVAIVLAAGSGSRFGAMKQFVDLTDGERLVDRAIAALCHRADEIVVVVNPASPAEHRQRLAQQIYPGVRQVSVVDGGDSRLDSVALGLAALVGNARGGDVREEDAPENALDELRATDDLVIVHDAAHPLASPELVSNLCASIGAAAACVPVLDAVDVIRRHLDDGGSETIGRAGLGSTQVPMVFDRRFLEAAHAQRRQHDQHDNAAGDMASRDAVEDSHLVELAGGRVVTVPGEVTNIHVVDDESLALVRLIATSQRG